MPKRTPILPRPSALALLLAAAASLALGCDGDDRSAVGEACNSPGDCRMGTSCYAVASGQGVCMAACEEGVRLCADGEVCLLESGGGGRVCYVGGDTPLGELCDDGLDCVRGGVCVLDGGEQRCYQACSRSSADPPCAAGEECGGFEGGGDEGFCRPPI